MKTDPVFETVFRGPIDVALILHGEITLERVIKGARLLKQPELTAAFDEAKADILKEYKSKGYKV